MSFLNSRFCLCPSSKFKSISESSELEDLLPVSFEYNLCNFERVDGGFVARFRVNISDKETALKWLEEFSFSSNTTFRTDKVYPQNTVGKIYKVSKYCHHRSKTTKEIKKTTKNTNCCARIVVTVKKTELYRNNQSKDIHLQDFPTVIVLSHTHNHPINSAHALRFRNPTTEVKEQYLKMFMAGYPPSKAFNRFKSELQEQYGDQYHIVDADRALCPDIQWVYNLYYDVFRKEYGEASGKNMLDSLKEFINKYNIDQGGDFATVKCLPDGSYIAVAVTPFMKRVLNHIPQASEVLFCDATRSVDRLGTKSFILFSNSCCGGLPVCVMLTSSEKEEAFVSCLESFRNFLDDNSFGGRGVLGPHTVMTDDDQVERNGFSRVFPNSTLLLCSFHVLQACWRYLCNNDSGVGIGNRQEIFFLFKKILYEPNPAEFERKFLLLMKHESVSSNKKVCTYFLNLYDRKAFWALHFRKNLILRGQNTNNICEAGIRVLKERILNRTKAYSAVQLFDYLVSDLNNFYVRKLISVANGRPPPYLMKKNFSDEVLNNLLVEKITDDFYEVLNPDTNTKYYVDMHIGLCSCYYGQSGAVCKHQQKISNCTKEILQMNLPSTTEERKKLLFIANGTINIPDEWFAPLHCNDVADLSTEIIQPDYCGAKNVTNEQQELHLEYNAVPEKDDGQVIKELDGVFKEILQKVESNPEMVDAAKKFIKSAKNIKTDSALKSALATFGKYGGFASRGKINLSSSKRIGVQPTALARRKVKCGGRLINQTGRPPKQARTSEHGYSKCKQLSSLLPRKKARSAAPHNVTFCTEQNISLGKKH